MNTMPTWNVVFPPTKIRNTKKMAIPIYQADAFTDIRYKGNPAAVCPLETYPEDSLLQEIAAEMNLSETAFFIPDSSADFILRWFTPLTEVRLCGHATLATAHIIFTELNWQKDVIVFQTLSAGRLTVRKEVESYVMDFPADQPVAYQASYIDQLTDQNILESYKGTDDLMLILENEDAVKNCVADLKLMAGLEHRSVIVSSRGGDRDFVSRVFAPACGIDEDPVTGSSHTLMTTYWAAQLGKARMSAAQISERRGELICELKADRVLIHGKAVTVMKGELL
jgi:PhzF family phenazine biosynthesis protein